MRIYNLSLRLGLLVVALLATTAWLERAAANTVPGNGTQILFSQGDGERAAIDLALLSQINPLEDGSFQYTGTLTPPTDQEAEYELTWSIITKSDPFISGVVGVSNGLAVPQDFAFLIVTPIAPALPNTLVSGSIGLTGSDGDGNGGTIDHFLGNAANDVYQAVLDGSTFTTLLAPFPGAPPFPLTFGAAGSNTISHSFGPIPGPAVNVSIGIAVEFRVSAHDLAGSTFNLLVVPEPAGMQLAGLATMTLLGGLGVRRFRRGSR